MKYVGSKYQNKRIAFCEAKMFPEKEFMNDLKQVYKAPTSERSDNSAGTRTKNAAEEALLELEQKWGEKYPMVINSWTNNWEELSAYFEYSEPIRRIIYTTNTVEGFNRQKK